MDDSAIMCDELIEPYVKVSLKDENDETNFNEKKSKL